MDSLDVAPVAAGVRLPWADVPEALHGWVEAFLGSPVVQAQTQPGGFSPGVAARLRCADGARAFVKAVSSQANPRSPYMHRREAVVTAAMPAAAPVPRLLSSYDDGTWVALLLEDVDGRAPALPWRADELDRVLDALAELAELLTPSPIPDIATAQEQLTDVTDGWRRLASAPAEALDALDPWSRRNLDKLVDLELHWATAAAGESLLHGDLRADNLLLEGDRVWVVDWPGACRGAPLFDLVAFAPSVAMQGGPQPEDLFLRRPASRYVHSDAVDVLVCAISGYFTHRSLQPPEPGLPTVRAFQAAQATIARSWLARRTGWA